MITELREYDHLGVKVRVHIDYDRETISLVESVRNGQGVFDAKKWVFASRSVQYMAGWRNILAAMEFAFTEAEKDLRKHIDVVAKKKMALIKELEKNDW